MVRKSHLAVSAVPAFAASALLALPVAAQETINTNTSFESPSAYGPLQGDWEFLLGGSGTNDKDFDNTIASLDVSLGNYVTDTILLGVRQNVSAADSDAGSSWNGSTVGFADYVFNLDRFRPFVGLTFGGLYGDDVEDTFIAGPQAGLKWYAKDDTFVFGRVNYDFLFESGDDAEDNFDDGRFVYAVGIGFNF